MDGIDETDSIRVTLAIVMVELYTAMEIDEAGSRVTVDRKKWAESSFPFSFLFCTSM